ncbi:MAG: hypothetical protein GC152_02290 [Alphaproteobacteria bacterium]|nr:hypothetical protein [Alphaproteobacteria bacterium]
MTHLLIGLFGLVVALAGAYALWARRIEAELKEGAAVAFERYVREEPTLIGAMGEDDFTTIYRRSNFPRFPKYFLASLVVFVAALPVVFGFLTGAVWLLDRFDLVAEPAELAKYVPLGDGKTSAGQAQREEMALYMARDFAGFFYFFGVIAAWVGIVSVSMKFYHARRPEDVRDELLRARDAAMTAPQGGAEDDLGGDGRGGSDRPAITVDRELT